MATLDYEAIVRTLFDDVFTKGNLNKCDELIAQNLQLHDVAVNKQFKGLQGFKEAEALYQKGFPGKRATIENMFVAGNKVIVHWKCTGTHKGNFNGCAATNKPINVTGISIYSFENGKICEIWQSWDRLGLYEQIGEVAKTHVLQS